MDLPHTVDITHKRATRDRYGGTKDAESPAESDVPAWVQPASGATILQYERRDQSVSHTVYFKEDKRLQPRHSLLWEGKTLRVVAFRNATSGMDIFWRADCLEDQNSEDNA